MFTSLGQLLHYEFAIRALLAGVLLSLVAPALGLFLVVRRFSLLADALAHVSLLGVALALLFRIPVFFGALGMSLLASVGIERLRSGGKILSEAVVALFLSSSLALSVVIIGLQNGLNAGLLSYLFGSLTTVSWNDVIILSGIAVFLTGFLAANYRSLFLIALDEELAHVSGVPVRSLNLVFMALTAATVAASLQIVGVLLVGALMVVPVLAAMQFRVGFRGTLFLAVGFSFVSVVVGFFLAFALNLPSGGSIVLVAVVLFSSAAFLNRLLR